MALKLKLGIVTLFLFFAGAVNGQTERRLSSFDKIRVGQAIELELIKGSTEKATLDVRGVDPDDVVTEVRGTTLRIYIDRDRLRNVEVSIKLTYKTLRGLTVSSAANVYSRSAIDTDDFFVDVSSAGSVEVALNVSDDLSVEVSSAGNCEFTGKAKYAEISVSSAGSFRGYDLEIQEADVRASSGGSARLKVTHRIDARASSGGSIRYEGNPAKEYTSSSSGGSIRRG